jgi:hypothetical protein
MQPGSQRWRKLKELEANVDKRNELMTVQAEQQQQQQLLQQQQQQQQQHHQFCLRQQSLNQEEEQLHKLKNVLYQQQVMLTQQSQFLNGYAWTMQSKEMLLEERAMAELGLQPGTSSSSSAAVQPMQAPAPLLSTSSQARPALLLQTMPEPAFVDTTYSQSTAVIEVKDKHMIVEVNIEAALLFVQITDDFKAVFSNFTLDFKELKAPPKLVVLQHGSQLSVKGAKLGDVLTDAKHHSGTPLNCTTTIDEAVELICEATSLTFRRPVEHAPAVSDPRNVSGKLRVKVYPKQVMPYPAPYK